MSDKNVFSEISVGKICIDLSHYNPLKTTQTFVIYFYRLKRFFFSILKHLRFYFDNILILIARSIMREL